MKSFTKRVLILVKEQGVGREEESGGGGRGGKSMQTALVQIIVVTKVFSHICLILVGE